MPEKNVRIIYVEWVDSIRSGGNVWTDMEAAEASKLAVCESAGFLIQETADSLLIAGHRGEGSVSGDIRIPKVAIKKRRWLK